MDPIRDQPAHAHHRVAKWVKAHPGRAVFFAALGVRLTALIAIQTLLPDSWLALDDATYMGLAADLASGETADWSPDLRQLFESTATFLIPLAALFWVFGPSQMLGSILVVLVGAGAAGLTTKVAARALPPEWALAAGGVVAFLPSQIGWSVTTLKDAWVWFVAAGVAYAMAAAVGSNPTRRVWPWVAVAIWLILLSHLRLHSTVVAVWAVALTVLVTIRPLRWGPVGITLVIALIIPWAAGGGPGGFDTVAQRVTDLEQVRAANAVGADSAFVDVPPATVSPDVDGANPGADVVHLPRGLSVMLLEPYPWEENRSSQIVFAKLDTILWYPVLGLALVGLMALRHHRQIVVFPLLYGGGVTLMYALAEGNLGTAFRHRGEAVWAAAILAAVGARELWARRLDRGAGS
ncbi:MAG TPA: hypothetical protein VM848_03635 [Acidimicrobiia bacterium]|nr:hypothetical protein [Acidimicrobiia bacterium]